MATIYDVAKAAGVSPKTVSRVLNGDAPVNARTRDAVNAAMAELDYVPSKAARSMRSRKSGLVGLITGAISMAPGRDEPSGLPDIFIVQGAQRVFAENGKTLMIADTGGDAGRVPELVQTFLEHRVEGLIYVAEFHQKVHLPRSLAGRAVVLANCYDGAGTPAVVPEDEGDQYEVVKGLVARGHRRIGFLTLPAGYTAQELRLKGYRRALEEAGIGYDERLVAVGAQADAAHEYDLLPQALDTVLSGGEHPTALCCANDKMAMRVYALLRGRGLDIPGDVSVVGYDDYRIITEHMHPALTSVDLPYGAMGARAAERLLRLLSGAEQPKAEAAVQRVSGPVAWRDSVRTYARPTMNM